MKPRLRTPGLILKAVRLPSLLAVAVLLSLAFEAEAQAGGAPKPVDSIVYKRDLRPDGTSTPKTTVYERNGLKLEASCETPYGTYLYLTVADEQGRLYYEWLDEQGGVIRRQFIDSNGGTHGINATEIAMGEIVYIDESFEMVTIDSLHLRGAFRGKDCSWSGLVRTIPQEKVIDTGAGKGGTRSFEVGDGEWELFCNGPTAVVIPRFSDMGEPVAGLLGVSFQDPVDDQWPGAVFSPIESAPANVDSEDAIMDQVVSRPDGTVSAWRGHIANPAESCTIEAFGRSVEKGPSRAFYAVRTGTERKKILDSGGLELYAKCKDDGGDAQLTLFAKTAADNAILKYSLLGDDFGQSIFGPTDFDAGPKPRQIYRLPEGGQMGHLMYVRPTGRVVAMNWAMSGDITDRKQCQFTGLASSAD